MEHSRPLTSAPQRYSGTAHVLVKGTVAAALTAVTMLAGCSPGGVTLRYYEELPPCDGIDPLTQTIVSVTDLGDYEECDLDGARLRFPTGELLEVKGPSSGGAQESTAVGYRIGWSNWGPDGVAAYVEEDGQLTIWGTRAGIRQQHRAQLTEDPDDTPGLSTTSHGPQARPSP